MRHNIAVSGSRFRLRPVELSDARFLLELRTDPSRARFLGPTPPYIEAQEKWIEQYFDRPGDYYFIVEDVRTDASEGSIGIYDCDEADRSAQWGRWVVRNGSLSAVESAYLIYTVGFELLGLERMYCRTAIANERVISFHDSFGLTRTRALNKSILLPDGPSDAVEHELTREAWQRLKPNIAGKIGRLAARMAG